jgi:hypothetical protein
LILVKMYLSGESETFLPFSEARCSCILRRLEIALFD